MHVLILRPYRKDNIYFRTIEEREKINWFMFGHKLHIYYICEPGCEKTGLRGFRPGPTQIGLYNNRRWLEA